MWIECCVSTGLPGSEDWPASKPSCHMEYLPGTYKPNGLCGFPWKCQPVSLQRSNSDTNHYCGYKYYISLFIFSLAFSTHAGFCVSPARACYSSVGRTLNTWSATACFTFPLMLFKWAICHETNRVSESVFGVFLKVSLRNSIFVTAWERYICLRFVYPLNIKYYFHFVLSWCHIWLSKIWCLILECCV